MALTAAQERAKRQRLKDDYAHYAANCLKIRTKSGGIEPLALNRAQQYLHKIAEEQRRLTGMVRLIVLKGRQQGISTYIEGRLYWRVTHRKGVRAFILTHEDAATANLYEMVQRYHEHCPIPVKPLTGAANAKELNFSKLDSGYKVGTAGTKGVGRSSTIQYFHGSETSFWPHADTHAMGVMQAVPREPDTEVFLESTANGLGNYYHAQWQLAEAGMSDFIAVFLPWYWQDEYQIEGDINLTPAESDLLKQYGPDGLTKAHLAWRRQKIVELSTSGDTSSGEWRFRQEYPMNAAEAFTTSGDTGLISAEAVMRARKHKARASGAKVVGVDPARYGDDSTGIAHRQGRECSRIESLKGLSTMQVAGLIGKLLQDPVTQEPSDIDMVFIDVGGLGAGIVDRLIELGFEDRITAVNFGEKALDVDRYSNKRAEMWCEMNEWLQMPVSIPDEDGLQADLCAPEYEYDSASRVVLESKKHMRARGVRSPDKGDALALTFALPVAPKGVPRHRIQAARPADTTVGY